MKNPSLTVAVAFVGMNEDEILISMATGEKEQYQNSLALEKDSIPLLHRDLQNVPKHFRACPLIRDNTMFDQFIHFVAHSVFSIGAISQ